MASPSQHGRLDVHVSRLPERSGVAAARNHAAGLANGDILFVTDAHVRFPGGWDELVYRHVRPDRIVAGVGAPSRTRHSSVTDAASSCRSWAPTGTKGPSRGPPRFEVAACPATVLPRDLFARLGGYDDGMIMYGAAEPEFSVRAWLSGAEIILVPQLAVEHRFKPQQERTAFILGMRQHMVCNGLRFGLLYADEYGALQLLRYYSLKFPNLFREALATVARSDVWARRAQLEDQLPRRFSWFVDHFNLKDQAGGEIK